jgi:monoamine oxidase
MTDLVIIGGGAAGVGAARRLAGSGLSVTLLEAASRLGGRAWTREVAGLDLDLGAGWLHSAERNSWAALAQSAGVAVDQKPASWGVQYRDSGFTREEQAAARAAFDDWTRRLSSAPPANDCAADALERGNAWNPYVRTIVGFISGAVLEQLSAADYVAYDEASSENNWRLPSGYGALIASSLPANVTLRLATPADAIELDARGVIVRTPRGDVHARAAIVAVSTSVLARGSLALPAELEPWREAARLLPLGRNEKLFLEILGAPTVEADKQVLGNPRDARTGAYYLRPFGRPVVEAFFGGESAQVVDEGGPAAAFAFAIDQLRALFGADFARRLRPLAASSWSREARIGGAYSYALPGHAAARAALARPFDQRLFFAGEATSVRDYSTAHGAHDSGARAAGEAAIAVRT